MKAAKWHSFDWKPKENGLYVVGSDEANILGLYLDGEWFKSLRPEEKLDIEYFGGWGTSEVSKEMNELRNKMAASNY